MYIKIFKIMVYVKRVWYFRKYLTKISKNVYSKYDIDNKLVAMSK